MAKIPPLRRLTTEDFKDQAGWIGTLLIPLNVFFEQTVAALNKGLTITENLAGVVQTVTVDGNFPIKLSWTVAGRPSTVLVGKVVRTDGTNYVQADPVFVQWQFNSQQQLQIDGFPGLLPKPKQINNPSADVNTSTGLFTLPTHEFTTGTKVVATSTGTLPTGLTSGTAYFVIMVDGNTFKLASTYLNALSQTAISVSTTGSGYHVFTPKFSQKFDITLECKVS